LEPAVEAALKRSIRDHPELWVGAIVPIVLPAIRSAIAAALRTMVENLNQMLEHSLSASSWQWRWESLRSGRPFAEVVLLRTLVFRVEQVLLIDRNSGLLLLAVSAPGVASHDTGLISAMLTAIQDFVHESFEVEASAGIRELHLGDFSLWIEQGRYACIAAAVRGIAPAELRETLGAALDLVHQECGPELRSFRGDSRSFDPRCRTVLEGCLLSRYECAKKPPMWKRALCIAALLSLPAVWFGIHTYHVRQWNSALRALSETPGLMIVQDAHAGRHVLEGFRDPLAESPAHILASHGIDPRRVSIELHPFISLDHELVLKRARAWLHPSGDVSITLDGDVLNIGGAAPHEWILQARNAAGPLGMAGVRRIRTSGLRDSSLDSLRAAIESRSIAFAEGSSAIARDQLSAARAEAAELHQWIDGAIAIGRVPVVSVIGYADPSGSASRNRELSRERADHVAALLGAASVPKGTMHVETAAPAAGQRKVVCHLELGDAEEVQKEGR
jgi:OOP family OmpA-OmpF porin